VVAKPAWHTRNLGVITMWSSRTHVDRLPARLAASARQLAEVANFFRYDVAEQRLVTMPRGLRISPTVSVRNGRGVTIGAGSHIGQWTSLWAGEQEGTITIGENALLAPQVFVTGSNYGFSGRRGPVMDLPKDEAPVHIGADTWLGVGVVVLPGVTIGDGAVVAAGSVVTRDVPANCLAAGVPAVPVRSDVRG
jgi:acetyltransferase-like isoleucine patch superfamily enzyme